MGQPREIASVALPLLPLTPEGTNHPAQRECLLGDLPPARFDRMRCLGEVTYVCKYDVDGSSSSAGRLMDRMWVVVHFASIYCKGIKC